MEQTIFKVGDRVFHIQYGWGVIDEEYSELLVVVFDGRAKRNEKLSFTNFNNKLLSFTEYTLDGFSQERKDIDPAYFGWHNPVLSRKEVFELIDDAINSNRGKTDIFFTSKLKEKIRELALVNAEQNIKRLEDNGK